MRQRRGDLMHEALVIADIGQIVIPTNMTLSQMESGHAVMGAGLAKQARDVFPTLPRLLAERMRRDGPEHIYAFEYGPVSMICLPTKRHWSEPSDIVLIAKMLHELVALVRAMGWKDVGVPRLGCGLGGLQWYGQVKDLMERLLDDRYTVYHPSYVEEPSDDRTPVRS